MIATILRGKFQPSR